MRRIDPFMYEVEPDEVVTMRWTAFKVIDSGIAMAVDQFGLEPDPEHPPTFSFIVTKPIDRMHFAAAEGTFPAGTPADARFSSRFSGSAGGDLFDGPTIRRSDPPALHSVDLVFRVVRVVVIAVACCLPGWPAIAQTTQEETAAMIEQLAAAAVTNQSVEPVLARASTLFLHGLVGEPVRAIAEARHETARTDKQIGASARAGGTTTVTERAGFARLLGFALERGALQQERSGSTYTLASTPYAVVALLRGDTGTTYHNWGALQRVGVGASFTLTGGGDPLAAVTRDNLVEASVRVRLTGDRSARSREFDQFWARTVRPAITARLVAARTGPLDFLTATGSVQERFLAFRSSLSARVAAGLKQGNDALALAAIIEAEIEQLASEVADNTLALDEEARARLRLLPAEVAAANAAVRQAMEAAEYQLLIARQAPIVTGVYAFQRGTTAADSNYSVVKLLYDRRAGAGGNVIANAAFSFYHDPNSARNQQRVRDVAVALSLEGGRRVRSALARFDNGAMAMSLSVRYQHLRENRGIAARQANIGVVQGRVNVPFGAGLALPVSISWATASELIDESHVTGHIGFSLDGDKLVAVAKALLPTQ